MTALHDGRRVKISGLVNQVALNGEYGTVVGELSGGRWQVKLAVLSKFRGQVKRIKEANLQPVTRANAPVFGMYGSGMAMVDAMTGAQLQPDVSIDQELKSMENDILVASAEAKAQIKQVLDGTDRATTLTSLLAGCDDAPSDDQLVIDLLAIGCVRKLCDLRRLKYSAEGPYVDWSDERSDDFCEEMRAMWKLALKLRTRTDPTGPRLCTSMMKICKSTYDTSMAMSMDKKFKLQEPSADGDEGLPIIHWMMSLSVASVPGKP